MERGSRVECWEHSPTHPCVSVISAESVLIRYYLCPFEQTPLGLPPPFTPPLLDGDALAPSGIRWLSVISEGTLETSILNLGSSSSLGVFHFPP